MSTRELRILEPVSGQECVTLRQLRSCKQGRVWEGPAPTRPGASSRRPIQNPRCLLQLNALGLLPILYPHLPWSPCQASGGHCARPFCWNSVGGRGLKFFLRRHWRGPKYWTCLQVRVTPPGWSWGERTGEHIKGCALRVLRHTNLSPWPCDPPKAPPQQHLNPALLCTCRAPSRLDSAPGLFQGRQNEGGPLHDA